LGDVFNVNHHEKKHHIPRFTHGFIGTIPGTFTQLFRIFGQLQIPWKMRRSFPNPTKYTTHDITVDGLDIQNQPVMYETPVNSVVKLAISYVSR